MKEKRIKGKKLLFYKSCLFLVFILGLFTVHTFADSEKDLYMDSRMQQMFTAKDGLPTTATTAIAQTSDGFMWFGGYGGLARYDGKKFRIFGAGQLSNVKSLLSGSENILWIGSTDQGLAKYENDEITFLECEEGNGKCAIECLLETEQGIYFGTAAGMGRVNSNGKLEILDIPELENEYTLHLSLPGSQAIHDRYRQEYSLPL